MILIATSPPVMLSNALYRCPDWPFAMCSRRLYRPPIHRPDRSALKEGYSTCGADGGQPGTGPSKVGAVLPCAPIPSPQEPGCDFSPLGAVKTRVGCSGCSPLNASDAAAARSPQVKYLSLRSLANAWAITESNSDGTLA